jgi:hypothetical protein
VSWTICLLVHQVTCLPIPESPTYATLRECETQMIEWVPTHLEPSDGTNVYVCVYVPWVKT